MILKAIPALASVVALPSLMRCQPEPDLRTHVSIGVFDSASGGLDDCVKISRFAATDGAKLLPGQNYATRFKGCVAEEVPVGVYLVEGELIFRLPQNIAKPIRSSFRGTCNVVDPRTVCVLPKEWPENHFFTGSSVRLIGGPNAERVWLSVSSVLSYRHWIVGFDNDGIAYIWRSEDPNVTVSLIIDDIPIRSFLLNLGHDDSNFDVVNTSGSDDTGWRVIQHGPALPTVYKYKDAERVVIAPFDPGIGSIIPCSQVQGFTLRHLLLTRKPVSYQGCVATHVRFGPYSVNGVLRTGATFSGVCTAGPTPSICPILLNRTVKRPAEDLRIRLEESKNQPLHAWVAIASTFLGSGFLKQPRIVEIDEAGDAIFHDLPEINYVATLIVEGKPLGSVDLDMRKGRRFVLSVDSSGDREVKVSVRPY